MAARKKPVVEQVKVIGGLAVPHTYALQVSGPGTVATYFLDADQVRKLFTEARIALIRTNQPDPWEWLDEQANRAVDREESQ